MLTTRGPSALEARRHVARTRQSDGRAEIGLLAEHVGEHLGESGKGEQIRQALAAFAAASRPDTLLPSERVLAEQFGVARMTVRGAIDSLETAGMIRREPGRGAFVQHPRLAHSEIFRSFTEDMRFRGMEPGARDFSARIEEATAQVAMALEIAVGDAVIRIERVRTADGIPMAFETSNLALARFPDLLDRMSESASLYEVLGTAYGVRLENAEQTVAIDRLSEADAARLETATGEPCFAIERRAHDNMGKAVEFGRSLYRGDRYVIEMHVGRAQHA